MSRDKDYILDLSTLGRPDEPAGDSAGAGRRTGVGGLGRPWLSVYWKCCHTYSRIYRSADGKVYQGRCPRCGRQATARVGEGGTAQRFFTAE